MRRRQKRGRINVCVSNALARLYHTLYEICCRGPATGSGYYGQEDIFQETILFVIQDPAAAHLKTDEEIIKHFKYRFQMIRFQIIKDNQQLKEINYADHIQAQKDIPEE